MMNLQQMQARYDEIEQELEELAAQWCSADHGGLSREEYGQRDAELVAERRELHRQWKKMDQLTREAVTLEAQLLRQARFIRPANLVDDDVSRRYERLCSLTFRAFQRVERRRSKRHAISASRDRSSDEH